MKTISRFSEYAFSATLYSYGNPMCMEQAYRVWKRFLYIKGSEDFQITRPMVVDAYIVYN